VREREVMVAVPLDLEVICPGRELERGKEWRGRVDETTVFRTWIRLYSHLIFWQVNDRAIFFFLYAFHSLTFHSVYVYTVCTVTPHSTNVFLTSKFLYSSISADFLRVMT